jgi:hypothetical protein
MPWNDGSEDTTYQTMSDVLTALTFILMLIMVTSVMLPDDAVVAEEVPAPEDIAWRTMVYTSSTGVVELDAVSYPDLATTLEQVAADDYVSVDVSSIASGEASFELVQAVQLAGLKHIYLSKSSGGRHGR